MKKGASWLMVEQGIKNPRDDSYSFRDWEIFKVDELPKAKAAAKRCAPSRVVRCEIVHVDEGKK